jgi:hypothetical protein
MTHMEQNLSKSPSDDQLEWIAPELLEFDVGIVTQNNASTGSDGQGVFTRS